MAIVNEEDGFTQLDKLNLLTSLLIQGVPVVATSDLLAEGQVIKFDAATNSFVYAGATVDPTTGIWTFDNSIEVPSGSIQLSETLNISEGGDVMLLTDEVGGGVNGVPNWTFDSDGGTRVFVKEPFSQDLITLQPDFSTVITTNPLVVNFNALRDTYTIQSTLKANGPMENFRLRISDTTTGKVLKYIPSKADWDNNTGESVIAGDVVANYFSDDADTQNVINLGFTPFNTDTGQALTLEVRADSIDLLGNAGGFPFLNFISQRFVGTEIPYIRDLTNIADNYTRLNAEYISTPAITGGVLVNFQATSTADTVTDGQFTAGVASTSNPTIITDGSGTFAQNDIIQITDAQANNGFYEVEDHTGTTLTIRGIGTIDTVEDFSKRDFETTEHSGAITKINVSVIRAGTDGLWETGTGSETGIVYDNFVVTTAPLTEGSVTFAGPTGEITEDNANLFYDDTNDRLGVGTNTPTVELDVDGSVLISGNAHIQGDAIVDGTLTAINTEVLNVADAHIYLNNGYTQITAVTSGLVVNFQATATSTTVSAGAFTAGIASTSNPTAITVGSATFAQNDLIQISGTNLSENDGIFEVEDHTGTTLTIRGVGTVITIEDFTQEQFITNASDSAAITKINLSVIRSGTDGLWEAGKGAVTPISFSNVVIAASALPNNVLLRGDGVGNIDSIGTTTEGIVTDDSNSFIGIRPGVGSTVGYHLKNNADSDRLKLIYDDNVNEGFVISEDQLNIGTVTGPLGLQADASNVNITSVGNDINLSAPSGVITADADLNVNADIAIEKTGANVGLFIDRTDGSFVGVQARATVPAINYDESFQFRIGSTTTISTAPALEDSLICDGGQLGIGAIPETGTILDVHGNGANSISHFERTAGGFFVIQATATFSQLAYDESNVLRMGPVTDKNDILAAADGVTLGTTGNMGIKKAPTVELDVNGSVAADDYQINGETLLQAGTTEPEGALVGDPGDIHIRAENNGRSQIAIKKEGVGVNTGWYRADINPPEIVVINDTNELEDLATGGIITVTGNLTIIVKQPIITDVEFVMSGAGFLTITAERNSSALINYTGAGTFISGTTSRFVVIAEGITLNGDSTGTLLDLTANNLAIFSTFLANWADLGSFTGSFVLISSVTFVNWTVGFDFIDCNVGIDAFLLRNTTPSGNTLFTYTSNIQNRVINLVQGVGSLLPTESIISISPDAPESNRFSVRGCDFLGGGDLFKQPDNADIIIDSMSDEPDSAQSLTVMASNGAGGTTITSTAHGFIDKELITITATTNYNGTDRVFNITANTFDMPFAFVADDATGTATSFRMDIFLQSGHGLLAGETIKLIGTDHNNGFTKILLNASATDLDINGDFIDADSGLVQSGNVSLDETDPRVLAKDNLGFKDSKTIMGFHVEKNAQSTAISVTDVYQDVNIAGSTGIVTAAATNGAGGTTMTDAAHGLANNQNIKIRLMDNYNGEFTVFNVTTNTFDIESPFVATANGAWESQSTPADNIERFRMIDEATGELEYLGLEPFEGTITASISAFKSGSTETYNFTVAVNGSIVQHAPFVERDITTALGNMVLIAPISMVTGDTFKLQVASVGTTNSITIQAVSVLGS